MKQIVTFRWRSLKGPEHGDLTPTLMTLDMAHRILGDFNNTQAGLFHWSFTATPENDPLLAEIAALSGADVAGLA